MTSLSDDICRSKNSTNLSKRLYSMRDENPFLSSSRYMIDLATSASSSAQDKIGRISF